MDAYMMKKLKESGYVEKSNVKKMDDDCGGYEIIMSRLQKELQRLNRGVDENYIPEERWGEYCQMRDEIDRKFDDLIKHIIDIRGSYSYYHA